MLYHGLCHLQLANSLIMHFYQLLFKRTDGSKLFFGGTDVAKLGQWYHPITYIHSLVLGTAYLCLKVCTLNFFT